MARSPRVAIGGRAVAGGPAASHRWSRRRAGVAALSAAGLLLAVAGAGGAAEPPSPARTAVDYLYVEANESAASGGHVALAIGEQVFHLQRDAAGWLRLTRELRSRFTQAYARLQNRTIHVQRLALDESEARRLRDEFNRRYLVQARQLDLERGVTADVALLEEFRAARRARAAEGRAEPASANAAVPIEVADVLRVPAAGYFYGDERVGAASRPPPVVADVRARSPAAEQASADGAPARPGGALTAAAASAPLDGSALDRAALGDLRTRIAALRGEGWLDDRVAKLRRELEHTPLPGAEIERVALRADALPDGPDPFSQGYLDATSRLLALAALRDGRPLSADAVVGPAATELALDGAETRALAAFADATVARLVALAASDRPGSGYALLVGLARLAALHRSLASGRLVVLDAYSTRAPVLRHAELARRADVVPELLAEVAEDLARARAALAAADGPPEESAYAAVEAAANRLLELRAGVELGRDVRLEAGTLLPMREAAAPWLVVPAADDAELDAALARARRAERARRERMLQLYGYALVGHNCVSEVFRAISAGLRDESRADAGETPGGEASARALAEAIDADGPLAVIPFVSAAAVAARYPVAEEREIPSYRRERIAEMAAAEGAFAVSLRESNTVTSTLYRRAGADSYFLFFTDGAPLLRPLLGAANLAVGAIATAVGMAIAPADGGETLLRGVRGLAASVPELAFVNIRKGSFDFAPRARHADEALADAENST